MPPESVGVPGREPPLELLPEALRSRLGGVFFFWGGGRRREGSGGVQVPCGTPKPSQDPPGPPSPP